MRRARLSALILALLSGCARATEEPEPERTRPDATARADTEIAEAIQAERARLGQELEIEDRAARARCPDELLPRDSDALLTLVVRLRDARAERRQLLPLALSASLESDEFSAIVRHVAGGAAALWDGAAAAPRSAGDRTAALAALEALEKQRYRAELLVDAYSPPRLFRRKDAPKSEWAAGSIAGRLVVADLAERRVLCQAPVAVRGDATGRPISRRLRESTRLALEAALGDRTWSELGAALSGISSVLRLPPSARRGSAAQRWAAPTAAARLSRAEPND